MFASISFSHVSQKIAKMPKSSECQNLHWKRHTQCEEGSWQWPTLCVLLCSEEPWPMHKERHKTIKPSYVCLLRAVERQNQRWYIFPIPYCGWVNIQYYFTAIYYNPSPPCYKTGLPPVLDELKLPIMQSVTNQFGIASGIFLKGLYAAKTFFYELIYASDKDDCLYKCMCYIIGLATGEIKFEPNHSQPSRKYGNFDFV